jgi:cytochrome c2
MLGAAMTAPADPTWRVEGGDATRGLALMAAFGCGGCHVVPGVRQAHGNVGPPLTRFADRTYIAGMLRNTPPDLVRWLMHPQSVVAGNAMPEMGITQGQARDIAAYLYTLH